MHRVVCLFTSHLSPVPNYCLVTEAHGFDQFAHGGYPITPRPGIALIIRLLSHPKLHKKFSTYLGETVYTRHSVIATSSAVHQPVGPSHAPHRYVTLYFRRSGIHINDDVIHKTGSTLHHIALSSEEDRAEGHTSHCIENFVKSGRAFLRYSSGRHTHRNTLHPSSHELTITQPANRALTNISRSVHFLLNLTGSCLNKTAQAVIELDWKL